MMNTQFSTLSSKNSQGLNHDWYLILWWNSIVSSSLSPPTSLSLSHSLSFSLYSASLLPWPICSICSSGSRGSNSSSGIWESFLFEFRIYLLMDFFKKVTSNIHILFQYINTCIFVLIYIQIYDICTYIHVYWHTYNINRYIYIHVLYTNMYTEIIVHIFMYMYFEYYFILIPYILIVYVRIQLLSMHVSISMCVKWKI